MISASADIVTSEKNFSASLKRRSFSKFLITAFCIAVAVSLPVFAQTGPGGVGNSGSNRLWLKADGDVYRDAGVTHASDGDGVRQWNDFSGNNNFASQPLPGNRPVYKAAVVNNSSTFPAIQFTDNTFLDPGALGIAGTQGFSFLTVVKVSPGYTTGDMDNGSGDYIIDRNAVTNELTSLKLTATNHFGFQKRDNLNGGLGGPVSTSAINSSNFTCIDYMRELPRAFYRLFINGLNEASVPDADGNLTPPVPRIGRHATLSDGGLIGYISELIVYNYRINNAQVNIVNSYLAAKYDLNITGNRYAYRSTNKYDVAGIGREDAGDFHDNATSAGILNISAPSDLGNGEYLLYGHNNGSVAAWVPAEAPSDMLNMSFLRVGREWRADKTGDVGTVTLTGDFSNFPAITAGYTIRALLVDSDGDFSSGATVYPLTDAGSNKYKVTNLTLSDGDYLTFAIYKVNNDDPCNAQTINVNGACTYQTFSNQGATGSAVADPGDCDGTGANGYSGGDVWFKVVVPSTGNVNINTDTESSSASNREWAYRVGLAVYSGTCAGLTKLTCQISPLSAVPPGNVSLSLTGRTPGETLYIRMWEWGNDNNGKFYLCAYDPCQAPPVITGSIAPSTMEACTVGDLPPAANSVADLEALGLNIADACTPDAALVVTHSDAQAGSCTKIVTRHYTITDASSISSTYDQIFTLKDTQAPVVTGSLSVVTIEGCGIGSLPAAVNTAAGLETLPGSISVADACTPDALLTVTHLDLPSGMCPRVVTRTYTVTDKCDNSKDIIQTIIIEDTTPPAITGSLSAISAEGCSPAAAPAAETTAAGLEALPGGITITDACAPLGNMTVTHSDIITGSCPYVITRTYTIEDPCHNPLIIEQIINVDDTQRPVITGTLTAATVEGCTAAAAPAAVTTVAGLEALAGGITITDACTPVASLTVSHSDAVSGSSCSIVITRTYTVSDECSNSVDIVHTININDTKKPVVTGSLSPITVEGCDESAAPAPVTTVAGLEALPGLITITDACTPDNLLSVTYADVPAPGCPFIVTRTYTVTDDCSNQVNIAQTINIEDTQPPVFTGSLSEITLEGCNTSPAPPAATTVPELEALPGAITVSDACTPDGLLTVSYSDSGAGSCTGIVTRTYTIKDKCDNHADIIQKINIDDTQPPVVTGSLTPLTAEGCDAGAAPPAVTTVAALEVLPGGISITDACTPEAFMTVSHADTQAGSCPVVITRTYTVTDQCSNSADIVQTINIRDTQPPLITGSLTPAALEGCMATVPPPAASTVAELEALPGTITITDACTPGASMTVSSAETTDYFCPRVITRTYTVKDECGNPATILHTIEIDDTEPPVITGLLSDLTVEGCDAGAAPASVTTVAALEALPGSITITDACTPAGNLTVSSADEVNGQFPTTITRTYAVTDECGNSRNITQTIFVNDTQAPVVTGSLTDAILEGCGSGDAPAAAATVAELEALPGGITINDACIPDASLAVSSIDDVAGTCPKILTRTYTVMDESGNNVEIIHTIRIEDTQPPVVIGALAPATVEGCSPSAAPAAATEIAGLEALAGNIIISDACTPKVSLTVSSSDVVSGGCSYKITRTYTVTDSCGHSVSFDHIIYVEDSTPPTFTAPPDITIYRDAVCGYNADISVTGDVTNEADNCGVGQATFTDAVNNTDPCSVVITRTWHLQDNCGNDAADQVQTITVEDNTPPTFTAPPDITIYRDAVCGYNADISVTGDVTNEADNCGVGQATFTDAVNNTDPCSVVITRTWHLQDNCGNAAADQVQTITVEDNTPPTFMAPPDITIYRDAVCGYNADISVTGDVTNEADNCGVGQATFTDAVNNTDPCSVVITRTWHLQDNCGNAAADQVQTINVEDNTPPTFTAPPDITIYRDAVCGYNADISVTGDVTNEADNCGVGQAAFTDAVNNTDPCSVVITRTWHLQDNCGNAAADQVQTITVEDNTPPTFMAPPDITIYRDAVCGYNADISVTGDVTNEADNCGVGQATFTDAVNNTDPCSVVITRTWHLQDNCGNAAADQVQTITVEDNTPPTFTAPPDITIYRDAVCGYNADISVTGDVTNEADNCGVGQAAFTDAVNNTDPCSVVITRTWHLQDNCGNAAADQVQTITVEDNTPPTFMAPPDITIYRDAVCGYNADISVTGDVTNEADNCGVGQATFTDAVNNTDPCSVVITRTWHLQDNCGNAAADQVQTITVEDNTPPTFTAPPDITIFKNATCGYDASVAVTGDVTDEADNCDNILNAAFTDVVVNGSCQGELIITRTWSLTDKCTNTTTHDQIITVKDITPPTFTAPPDITIFKNSTCGYDASVAVTGDVTDEADNCDNTLDATFTDVVVNGSCQGELIITRTWSLTDDCTNTTTHDQIITVRDNTKPTFTVPPDITIYKNASCGYDASVAVTGDVTDVADNCDNTLNATFTDVVVNGSCQGELIITRTWSLTDDCSNTTTHDQIIMVKDNTPPTFTAPPDIYICRASDCTYDIIPVVTGDVINENDNCSTGLNAVFSDDVSGAADCDKAGIIIRRWSLTDNCGNAASDQFQYIYVNPVPEIVVSQSDTLLCFTGGSIDFTVSTTNTVTPGSLWRYDVHVNHPAGVTGSLPSDLTDLTAPTLTDNLTNNTDVVQTVIYTFKPHIRPGDGGSECRNVDSVMVSVDLDPQPKITVTTDPLLCYDGDAVFNISTVNSPLHAGSQWRYDVSVVYPAGITGSLAGGLTDQTAPTLTDNLTNNSDVVQTVTYTFTPHIRLGDGGLECGSGDSVTVHVDLDPQPKIAVTTDTLLCHDGDAVFDISTVNSPLHAGSQWWYDVHAKYPAGVTGSWSTDLLNQVGVTLTDNLTNNSDVVQTVTYTFTPHIRPGDGGSECGNGVADTVRVDLDPRPKIAVTTDTLLCYDGDAVFDISTVNSPLHAGSQWRYDVSVIYPAGVTGSWPTGLIDQTANTLTDNLTNNSDVVQTVVYTFTPHIKPGDGGSECHGGIPVIISVDLDPQPKISVTTDPLLCYDGDAVLDISTVNSPLHAGSLWRYDVHVNHPAGVTGSLPADLTDQTANTLTDNLTNNTDVVQTVTYIFKPHIRPGDGGSECSNGVPDTVRVDLDPRPRITVNASTVLCNVGDAVFDISTVNSPLHAGSLWRYDVHVNHPAGVTGSLPADLTDQTANTLTDNLTNNTDVVQTVTYIFTPHIRPGDGGTECLNGVVDSVKVLIDPLPRIFPVPPNTTQCDSTLTNIELQSPSIFSSGSITFDQTVTGDGSVTGYPSVPVTGLPNNHTIADRLINLTDAYHTVTYTIVPVSPTGCPSGQPEDVTVTVNPTPRAIALNTNMKPDSSICYGGTTRVTLTSPTVMTSGSIIFDYNVNVTGAPGDVVGNTTPQTDQLPGYIISYPYQNNSDTIQSVYYNVIPKVDNAICVPGRTAISQVKVHAKPLQNLLITVPLTCNGGSDAALRAVSSKGAGLYYFDWIRPGTAHIFGYGISDLTNVIGGRWEVTVTDNLGCSNAGSTFVAGAFFDEYMYVVDTTGYGTTCPGSNDGELWIKEKSSSTAIPPFEYWVVRNDADTVIHSILPATEVRQIWHNLSPGTYKLYVRDANLCENDHNNPPIAVITEPDRIQVTFDALKYPGDKNTSCRGYDDGSVWITNVTGGNGGYRYKWYTFNGTITGPDTLNRLDSVTAGTYYLLTTDRKGCVQTDSVMLTEPDGMVLTGSEVHYANDGIYNISCNGGSDGYINLTITGGSGNYLYSWTGPGSFTASTRDISGLSAGTYVCTVTDVNGCILMPVPRFVLTEPPPLSIASALSVSTDGSYNVNCFGGTGSIDITVTGGIPGTYIYEWSTADGSGLIAGQEDQPALRAGTYHLKVTDINNCESSADITLIQPAVVSLTFSVSNITCQSAGFNNGSIDLTASGGISPYTYIWSNGQITGDISGLTEGSYSVTVTDLNGCSITDSVKVNPPPPVNYSKTVSEYNGYQVSCYGMTDGYIHIDPTSGQPPYTYLWSGPDGFSSSSKDISGLGAGEYILTITDNNFCTATDTFALKEAGKLGMNVSVSSGIAGGYNINCTGSSTGSISVEPVNPAGNVEYLWSDGIFGGTRTDIPAGNYRVIISDANNCYADTAVTLTEPDSIKLNYQVTQPLCHDKPDGRIVLNVTGGVPGTGYTYLWSDNSSGSSLTNIPAGDYSVTVSDLNGCQVVNEIEVDPLHEVCLEIPEAISPNGDNINDVWNIGQIDLYPDVEIVIYNRWGEKVWKSARGYPKPWDGTSNGKYLPIDSYHYLIELHSGAKPILGNVTIVR